MLGRSSPLKIYRNYNKVIVFAVLVVLAAAFAIVRWEHTAGAPPWIVLIFAFRLFREIKALTHLVVDETGVTAASPPRAIPWTQIEACAFQREGRRRVLRLFLKPQGAGASATPFDINLSVARRRAADFEAVRRALAARVAVREFPSDAKARAARRDRSVKLAAVSAPLLLAFAAVIGFFVHRPVFEEAALPVDARPGQAVLFLGNSRTYGSDLPRMVRGIADSADSPIRYDMHMRAWANATLSDLWDDKGDREALKKPWQFVILQPESGAFEDDESAAAAATYGEKLIRAGEATGARVAVMANWTREPRFFGSGDAAVAASRDFGRQILLGTRALADATGAGVIDLAGAFAEAAAQAPDVKVTFDGNQPTVAGSYLAALVVYGYLSHADLAKVDWRPAEMSAATAARLQAIAARHAG